jgi:hypothetical protein
MATKKDKKGAKELGKKSMKKTKGGLLPAVNTQMGDGSVRPDGRYAGKYVAPTDLNFSEGTSTQGV